MDGWERPGNDWNGQGDGTASVDRLAGPIGSKARADREAEQVEWSSKPHPWRRWFARIIDILFAGVLAGILVELIDPGSPFWDSGAIVEMAVLAFWVIPEALILSTFGSTPGKGLLNIRVRRSDGRMLRFDQALLRSAYVWAAGLGLGIPLANLVTVSLSYGRLKRGRRTLWDEAGDFTVRHGPIGAGRIVSMVLLAAFWAAMLALGGAAG